MNEIKRLSNPIDHILNYYEHNILPTKFDVLNARDELNRLKKQKADLYEVIAWARVNENGDLYDPRFIHNPYINQDIIIPLYINREEFKTFVERLKNA